MSARNLSGLRTTYFTVPESWIFCPSAMTSSLAPLTLTAKLFSVRRFAPILRSASTATGSIFLLGVADDCEWSTGTAIASDAAITVARRTTSVTVPSGFCFIGPLPVGVPRSRERPAFTRSACGGWLVTSQRATRVTIGPLDSSSGEDLAEADVDSTRAVRAHRRADECGPDQRLDEHSGSDLRFEHRARVRV